jgi:hypothetical protein
MHNDGEKEEKRLVVRNAGFVESARDEEIAESKQKHGVFCKCSNSKLKQQI